MPQGSDQQNDDESLSSMMKEESPVAAQAIQGSFYSVSASSVTWTLGALRLILLTRWLLPDDVGVFTQAMVFVILAVRIYRFGLNPAVIHRQDDEGKLMPTFLSLRLVMMTLVLGGLALMTPLIARWYADMAMLGMVMLALILAEGLDGLNDVQMAALEKQMSFRRIATADVISSLAMTIVAPVMAWQGMGVWALVGEQISGYAARSLVVWTGSNRWHPKVGWQRDTARWLLNYGGTVWLGGNLTYVLDRFDDFWIGSSLGATSLGYYARAYEFARYSRRVIANPILSVFFPTYAKLQADRERLSRAFFRSTHFMIRSGALFSLLLIFTASEFIPLLLGEQWLPMLMTFQLMIVYTFLDPIALSASNLLSATGHAQTVLRIRILQAVLFIPAVILLSRYGGIEGVAIAADAMVLSGTILLFDASRRIVDYSSRHLWLWPLVAMVGVSATIIVLSPVWQALPLWGALFAKILVISLLYGSILWFTEREQLANGWRMIWGLIAPRLCSR